MDARKRITARTKAIMTVHYASGFGDLAGVYALAAEHKLRVIEDAAHSFGGFYAGKRVGASGDVVCFSFDGIKNLTCGEGGAVVSRDAAVIERVADLRLLAIAKDTEQRYKGKRSFDFNVEEQGWRYHLSNLNAAIGRAQLKKIDAFGERRRALFQMYNDLIPTDIAHPVALDLANIIPHPYVLFLTRRDGESQDDSRARRNALMETLSAQGIETGLLYKPNHKLSYFAQVGQDPYPVAEDLWSRMITLPLHSNLSDADVTRVSNAVVEATRLYK
jgi:dTDP-4-amino-4,6-dideoxygalactose transaminase